MCGKAPAIRATTWLNYIVVHKYPPVPGFCRGRIGGLNEDMMGTTTFAFYPPPTVQWSFLLHTPVMNS